LLFSNTNPRYPAACGGVLHLKICAVNDIKQTDDGVILKTSDGDIAAQSAVIATGAWSATLAKPHGANVPLETERGYHIVIEDPSVSPAIPVMDTTRKFVSSPMSDGLRLAGVVEFGGL